MKGSGAGRENEKAGRQLVGLRQLAEEWACSRQTVRRLLARAGIQPYYLHDGRNGTLRYSRSEVDGYLEGCKPKGGPTKKM